MTAEKLPEITPEFRQLIHSLDLDVSDIMGQVDRLFTFLRKVVRGHGGQLHRHNYESCAHCYAEERKRLENEHPNWRQETNEIGCCDLCAKRAIDFYRKQAKQASKQPIVQVQEQGHGPSSNEDATGKNSTG
jgi:hypothetical protein